MLQNITVIGSGSWATALVKATSESGLHVSWLVRSAEQAEHIRVQGRNPRYLSYADLETQNITTYVDVKASLQDSQLVIIAVPSTYMAQTIATIKPEWVKNKQLAVSVKGFVPSTGNTPAVYVENYFPANGQAMVLAGPCHAEEIAMKRKTYLTIAGQDEKILNELCEAISVPYVTTIQNNDPKGVEYAAILKNIIGIATGMAGGLNYGENFQAVITSNAMREIEQFLAVACPAKRDLFNSAYFGDMLVTAYSDYSRNRTLGKLIGRGFPLHKALQAMEMVAEGYNASKELYQVLKKLALNLPLINCVYRVLHLHANPFHEFKLIEKQLV